MVAPFFWTSAHASVTARQKTRLLQVGSVLLGVGLLYLALRPVSFDALWESLAGANYWYLVPLVLLILLSHLLRSWRWLLFLEALPGSDDGRPPSLRLTFYSVMIGYMVNYAAPRVGEVARAGNLAAHSRVPFSGAFGTVVVERVLDVLTLAVGIAVAFAIAAPQMARLVPLVGAELSGFDVSARMAFVLGLLVLSGLFLGYMSLLWLRRRARLGSFSERLMAVLVTFKEGLLTLLKLRRRVALVTSTIAIWVCYWLLAYILIPMLGVPGVSLADAWVLMIVGSAAMIVPAPGGIGSFHYATIQTLTLLFGVSVAPATAYAVLGHGSQLILYTIGGFACLLLQGRGIALRLDPEDSTREEELPATSTT